MSASATQGGHKEMCLNVSRHCRSDIRQLQVYRHHALVSLLVLLIRSLPETEEVRSRLDVNSESVMDKSALNDDQQEQSEASSGLSCCYGLLVIAFTLIFVFCCFKYSCCLLYRIISWSLLESKHVHFIFTARAMLARY